MIKIICAVSFFLLALMSGQAFPEKKMEDSGSVTTDSQNYEIIVSGKLFCPVKRRMVMPFHCTIISLNVRSGQQIKAEDVLARYRLAPEDNLKLRKRVSSFDIEELEIKLAENHKHLINLEDKNKDIRQLSAHDMAPSDSLIQNEREIELAKKKREYLQKRLKMERALDEEERVVVEELLGNKVSHGHVPQDGTLKAPIGNHVLWVHPDLREDAEFNKGTAVVSIGVMDPMLLRAHVHEIEAVQLKLGDLADFTLESIPGRKFQATVSRISWETLTPQLDRPSYYEVEFELPNPDFILREGLRGRIIFRKSE